MTVDGNATGESITVSVAAERLGVTLPRLLRQLKRPEFASLSWQEERKTRTGTRTVTLVSVTSLEALKRAFSEASGEQKRERSRGEALGFDDPRIRALLELYTRDQRERIEEQARTIADLRDDKARLQGRVEALEEEKRLLLEKAPEFDFTGSGGVDGASTGVSGQNEPPERRERGFWSWLRRR